MLESLSVRNCNWGDVFCDLVKFHYSYPYTYSTLTEYIKNSLTCQWLVCSANAVPPPGRPLAPHDICKYPYENNLDRSAFTKAASLWEPLNMETKQNQSCLKGTTMQNPSSIEIGLRECFQAFMAEGLGPAECAHCPTYRLCAAWGKGEHDRVLFTCEDIVDAETGEVICQIH